MIRLHFCALDRTCRSVEAPPRVYLHLGKHSWYIDPTNWSDRGHHTRGRRDSA